MFGLTFEKLLIIGVIAVFLLGPERLPHYAAQLGRLVRSLRDMANGAKDRMRDEMGPDFDDVDWKKLDPRQYDPRRIIREALTDVDPFAERAAAPVVAPCRRSNENSAYLQRKRKREALGAGRTGAVRLRGHLTASAHGVLDAGGRRDGAARLSARRATLSGGGSPEHSREQQERHDHRAELAAGARQLDAARSPSRS